ncbi:peptidase C12, ubiquitin carboxyl-terminal hydrolase [Schizophyllum commune]
MTDPARISYIPLESNPDVFNTVTHTLGATNLEWHDVLSLDEPDLLALVPRPVLALALIFPTNDRYEAAKREIESRREPYTGTGEAEDLIWYKQTIYNACGTYAILHAVSNGAARGLVDPKSAFGELIARCKALDAKDRPRALEESVELRAAHEKAAVQGDTAAPANAADEVDYHYTAFAPSRTTHRVYELDGDKKGPLDTGLTLGDDGDMLSPAIVDLIKGYIARDGISPYFGLIALVQRQ